MDLKEGNKMLSQFFSFFVIALVISQFCIIEANEELPRQGTVKDLVREFKYNGKSNQGATEIPQGIVKEKSNAIEQKIRAIPRIPSRLRINAQNSRSVPSSLNTIASHKPLQRSPSVKDRIHEIESWLNQESNQGSLSRSSSQASINFYPKSNFNSPKGLSAAISRSFQEQQPQPYTRGESEPNLEANRIEEEVNPATTSSSSNQLSVPPFKVEKSSNNPSIAPKPIQKSQKPSKSALLPVNLEMSFNKAVKDVEKLKIKPTGSDRLELYALLKQATEGDIKTLRPLFTGVKEWDAWFKKRGMSRTDARQHFVQKVNEIIRKQSPK